MSIASLFLIVILANVLLFTECKPIKSQSIHSNASNVRAGLMVFVNDSFKLENKTCSGNCNEKNPNTLSEVKQLCPYESKELCLIYQLSKIAKVQVAALSEASRNRNLKSNILGGLSKHTKNLKNYQKFRGENPQDNFLMGNEDDQLKNVSLNQAKSTNIHCRAIQDVYIPEAGQKLPAFACQLRNNTFILSSERFLQDRRLYLDIRVDENTLKNIKLTPKMSRSRAYNAIPALLVLNTANNGYTIEMNKNISHESNLAQETRDR